ncbi:hypothetical protein PM082_002532 [Marasmius tenuissimus]|nr:hypothetical protein PM082_002532 [Marasmius tenuissimus]
MTPARWVPSKGTLIYDSVSHLQYSGVKRVDIAQLQPTDRPVEDRFSLSHENGVVICGVYDGHGGSETADYISKELPGRITTALENEENTQLHSQRLIDECLKLDREIHESFAKTFRFLRSVPFREQILSTLLSQSRALLAAQRAKAGSTALLARISSGHVELMNVGDCRAVMTFRDNNSDQNIRTEQLTNDQNPHHPEEVQRLRAEHPGEEDTVIMQNRVLGRIGTTRSFGDVYYKEKDTWLALDVMGHPKLTPKHGLSWRHQSEVLFGYYKSPPYLTAMPEVRAFSASPASMLVMATDGLWSLVDNEWVAENIWTGVEKEEQNIALYLLKRLEEEHKYPGDDTTVIVLHLENKV